MALLWAALRSPFLNAGLSAWCAFKLLHVWGEYSAVICGTGGLWRGICFEWRDEMPWIPVVALYILGKVSERALGFQSINCAALSLWCIQPSIALYCLLRIEDTVLYAYDLFLFDCRRFVHIYEPDELLQMWIRRAEGPIQMCRAIEYWIKIHQIARCSFPPSKQYLCGCFIRNCSYFLQQCWKKYLYISLTVEGL